MDTPPIDLTRYALAALRRLDETRRWLGERAGRMAGPDGRPAGGDEPPGAVADRRRPPEIW